MGYLLGNPFSNMGKTYRANSDYNYFRKPKTQNSRKKIKGIVSDPDLSDYPVSKLNRARSMDLPSSWDDLPVAGRRERWHK